eukprot:jgi/Mesvir1/28168/Mv04728-RA.1
MARLAERKRARHLEAWNGHPLLRPNTAMNADLAKFKSLSNQAPWYSPRIQALLTGPGGAKYKAATPAVMGALLQGRQALEKKLKETSGQVTDMVKCHTKWHDDIMESYATVSSTTIDSVTRKHATFTARNLADLRAKIAPLRIQAVTLGDTDYVLRADEMSSFVATSETIHQMFTQATSRAPH